MDLKGHTANPNTTSIRSSNDSSDRFVLDKSIFTKVFEKDVRRVYVYKRCERIARALNLVTPAFRDAKVIKDRLQKLSLDLIDASSRPLSESRETLSRDLLTLSSILSMARAGGLLSPMNVEVISREAHSLLQDIAAYEDTRISLDEVPSLASIARAVPKQSRPLAPMQKVEQAPKGQVTDIKDIRSRRDSILSILKSKGPSFIKDISMVIRNVSEKTIQRELQILVLEGVVTKTGERRWTKYEAV